VGHQKVKVAVPCLCDGRAVSIIEYKNMGETEGFYAALILAQEIVPLCKGVRPILQTVEKHVSALR